MFLLRPLGCGPHGTAVRGNKAKRTPARLQVRTTEETDRRTDWRETGRTPQMF